MSVLYTLRQKMRSKEAWVDGADKYRHPDRDLPADLELPSHVGAFIQILRWQMRESLTALNEN